MKGNNSVNISRIIEKHYVVHNLLNYSIESRHTLSSHFHLKGIHGLTINDAFSSLRVPVSYLTSLGSKVILNTNAIKIDTNSRDHLK